VCELRVESGGVVLFEAFIRVPVILAGPSSCGLYAFRFYLVLILVLSKRYFLLSLKKVRLRDCFVVVAEHI